MAMKMKDSIRAFVKNEPLMPSFLRAEGSKNEGFQRGVRNKSPLSFESTIQSLHLGSKPLQHISMLDPPFHQKSRCSSTLSGLFAHYSGDILGHNHPPLLHTCASFNLGFLLLLLLSPLSGWHLGPLFRPLETLLFEFFGVILVPEITPSYAACIAR